jgi:hypothetical protein
MDHARIIDQALRDAQDILWTALPATPNLPDDATTVQELREIVFSPPVAHALKCAADTFLSFELRAVLRILAEGSHSDRAIIDSLWCILDHPELNQALGTKQNSHMIFGPKKPPAR